MSNKTRLSIVALGMLSLCAPAVPALADGMPYAPESTYAASPFNWAGLYFGLDGGYAWGDVAGVYDSGGAASPLGTLSSDGALIGAHAGYNFQFGKFILGVEGDYSGVPSGDDSLVDSENDRQRADFDALASLRGVFGYNFGPAMIYGTVGFGWAKFALTVENGQATRRFDQEGAVYGGGLAWMIAPHISLRTEYLHYDVGERHDIPDDALPGGLGNDSDNGDFVAFDDVDVIRAGLTFHLN